MLEFAKLERRYDVTTNASGYGSPRCRERQLKTEHSPLAPRRTAPVLQRRPDAAREAEAIDRCRRAQRFEAMQLDAAPLEAGLLQNFARRRIAHPRAGDQVLDIEFLEGEIDHRPRRFGGKTLAPMFDAEPIAEFRCVRLAPVDADNAERRVIVLDQEYRLASVGRHRAHELYGIVL